jgi:hypothetical protein
MLAAIAYLEYISQTILAELLQNFATNKKYKIANWLSEDLLCKKTLHA